MDGSFISANLLSLPPLALTRRPARRADTAMQHGKSRAKVSRFGKKMSVFVSDRKLWAAHRAFKAPKLDIFVPSPICNPKVTRKARPMFSTRLIFTFAFLYVVFTKLALFAAQYFDIKYAFPATIYIITTAAIAISALGLTALIARKLSWLDGVNTSKISDESLQHVLLQMLMSLFLFAAGTAASYGWKEEPILFFPALAVAITAAIWLYKSALLYFTYAVAAQKNPALRDERTLNNQRDSDKWAFVGCFVVALILGYLDFIGLAPNSGATVGFSAAIFGAVVGLMRLYWLEKRDG